MGYSVQVCFATGQADANLLPILSSNTKLEKVIMLTTPTMKKNAEWFKSALRSVVPVEIIPLKNDLDVKEIYEKLGEILPEYEGRVIFNLTGGTKLMTIDTFIVCSTLDIPFFYLELQTFKLYYFEKFPLGIGNEPKIVPIGSEVMGTARYIKTFLEARGYQTNRIQEWGRPTEDQRKYFDFVMQRCSEERQKKLMEGIKPLNKAASEVKENNSSELEAPVDLTENLNWFLDEIISLDWVKFIKKPYERKGKLVFKNKEVAEFLAGGWFELYCARILKELNVSTKIFHGEIEKEGIKNELDAIFLLNGKLHLIEVKTSNLKIEPKARDILYKLDSLRRSIGGSSSKACVLSLEEIERNARERAESLNIALIQGVAGRDSEIKRQLKSWINQ